MKLFEVYEQLETAICSVKDEGSSSVDVSPELLKEIIRHFDLLFSYISYLENGFDLY